VQTDRSPAQVAAVQTGHSTVGSARFCVACMLAVLPSIYRRDVGCWLPASTPHRRIPRNTRPCSGGTCAGTGKEHISLAHKALHLVCPVAQVSSESSLHTSSQAVTNSCNHLGGTRRQLTRRRLVHSTCGTPGPHQSDRHRQRHPWGILSSAPPASQSSRCSLASCSSCCTAKVRCKFKE